jgi:hypothetical protein
MLLAVTFHHHYPMIVKYLGGWLLRLAFIVSFHSSATYSRRVTAQAVMIAI